MSFSRSLPVFSQLAEQYNKNKSHKLFVKNATLIDLTEALGAVFVGFETTDKTVPPQAKYNATVVSALEKLHVFQFVSGLLDQLCDFYDSEFAFCTVNVPLGKFPRPSRDEFQQFKHLYVLDQNMNTTLGEVFPIEIFRAVRLHLMNLLFRFFNTYDVDETFVTKDGKTHYTCDSSKATFRSKGHNHTTAEFCSFAEYLIKANRYLKQLSLELTELSQPFRDAAQIAKAERVQYAKAQAQAKFAEAKAAKTKAAPVATASPTLSPRQASLQKTFSVDAKPFVPATPPAVNPWNKRKEASEAAKAAKAAREAQAQEAAEASEASGAEEAVEPIEPIEPNTNSQNDGEYKLVAKKKRSDFAPQKKRDRFRAKRS